MRRALLLPMLATTWNCAGESGNAVAPIDVNTRVASLSIQSPATAVLTGDTAHLVAIARDDAGRILHGATVSWDVSDASLATIAPGGRFIAQGHGAVTVSASAGRGSATTSVAVRLTEEERRFAYVWVHDASGRSAPGHAFRLNETGGGIVVSRPSVGRYVVTFERLAKVDSSFRETVLVTPSGTAGERCHLDGWNNAANGDDLDVSVTCYDVRGARVDARFSVLIVGSASLPSRLGFTVAGDVASSFASHPSHTFSSFSRAVTTSRASAGSYVVRLGGASDDSPQSYFVSTHGSADDLCKVSSWNRAVWGIVTCYAPSGALSDARFSLLMLERGRPGRRFGFAWANEPANSLGTPYTPDLRYQRTSSGEPVRVTREAPGRYLVSFPGLAKVGSRPETVHVSPYGGGLYSCQLDGWGNNAEASALDATVRCRHRGNGNPADTYFTILVLE